MSKTVSMIWGVTGQIGSYLVEILLQQGHYVVGIKRRTSVINTSRIDHLYNESNFKLEYGDLTDVSSMFRLLMKYKPDEIYNLACQSHVRVSFDLQEQSVDSVAMGTLRILNCAREIVPNVKYYQSSSSEMFGDNPNPPFHEKSIFMPVSPYACAKVFAHNIVQNYRKSYNFHGSCGIMFNTESPRRGETFVTRKITMAAAAIKYGLQEKLYLGNLESYRDWSFAKETAEAMYKMLQQKDPDDYVIAAGESHSVEEFLIKTFQYMNIDDYKKYVEIDERLFRPQEVPYLQGNPKKAKQKLGWEPKIKFEQLVKIMCDADLKLIKEKYKK